MMIGPLFNTVTLVVDMVSPMVARILCTHSSPRFAPAAPTLGARVPFRASLVAAALLCLLIGGPLVAQPGNTSAPDALVAALRQAVTQSVNAAPNHTCRVEVQRMQDKVSLRQKMEEQAVLEVAFLEGRERYAWPGASLFREDELRDILVMGLSGSGSYAEHLRSVALSADTVFGRPMPQASADPPVFRIPYRVPAARSGYLVNLDGKEIEAAIQGEITFRPSDAAVLAFTLEAVDLPPGFPATAVTEAIRYQLDSVASFRPPAEAVQRMVESRTDEYVNRYRFLDCRQFRGESAIQFSPSAELDSSSSPAVASPKPAASAPPLPAGAPLELRLKQSIVWEKSVTGDLVEAEITRPLKFVGQLIADTGATVQGRLVEFKRLSSEGGTAFFVGIRFESIVEKGKTTPVALELNSLVDMPKSNRRGLAAVVRGSGAPYEVMDRVRPDGRPFPAVGFIRALGDPTGLPAGLVMRWIAVEAAVR